MMKRLLPVAAAVVIGLSPSFASAANGTAAKTSNAAQSHGNHVASNPWNADYASDGANSILDGSNGLSIKVGGGLGLVHVADNQSPYYFMNADPSTAVGSNGGERFVGGIDLDTNFMLNQDVNARLTLQAARTLRSTWYDDADFDGAGLPTGGNATVVGDMGAITVQNAYFTWQAHEAVDVRLGLTTTGLTAATAVGANQLFPRLTDYMQIHALELGASYSSNGFTVGAQMLDPGAVDSTATNSRNNGSQNNRHISNWSITAGYEGKAGGNDFGVHGRYLYDMNDLSYLSGMNSAAVGAQKQQKHVYAFDANMDFGAFGANAYWMKFEKNANKLANKAGTNDSDMMGIDVTWDGGNGMTAALFYDNADDNFNGLFEKTWGIKGTYALNDNATVVAELRDLDGKTAAQTTANATLKNHKQFALGVSLHS